MMSDFKPEIWSEIFSYIPYLELAKIRTVCKSFDELVDGQFKVITYVKLIQEGGSSSSSLVEPILYEPSTVKAIFELQHVTEETVSGLISILENKCPLLQAIDLQAVDEAIRLSYLTGLGRNLKFIRAIEIDVDIEYARGEEIVQKFPALVAFEITYPEYPFCQKFWASKTEAPFIMWKNICPSGRCECDNVSSLNYENIKIVQVTGENLNGLSLESLAPSLEALDLYGYRIAKLNCLEPPVLRNLKNFSLKMSREVDMDSILFYLQNSLLLRQVNICSSSMKSHDIQSLLSFLNNLPHLRSIEILLREIENVEDTIESINFGVCEKNDLRAVSIQMWQSDRNNNSLINSLLRSSRRLNDVLIVDAGESEETVFALKKGTLCVWAATLVNLADLLNIMSQHSRFIRRLKVEAEVQIDVTFVEVLLTFQKLQTLQGRFTKCFIENWLPRFLQSNNSKPLSFKRLGAPIEWFQETLSRETVDLILDALENGTLSGSLGHG